MYIEETKKRKNRTHEREEKEMKVELIGIASGTYQDKNGKEKEATTVYFKQPFSDYESHREGMECNGFKVGMAFYPRIVKAQAGDIIDLEYEPGFQDKATLVNITVVSSAKKSANATV